ncbi:hypothetical protein MKEN_00556700 [Mycena kentingensis (nom. inval.)]|nr:hypothetical protein MKEN_00556700 [Mycena kentingensis (nom. inval.)]
MPPPHSKPPSLTFHETADEFWFDMADLWVVTFFYGIYLVLFCICIYILLRRPRSEANWVPLITAILLFVLSTTQIVLDIVLGAAQIYQLRKVGFPSGEVYFADNMIYVVNNIIAGGLITYRCWLIWNKNHYILLPGITGLVITTVFGADQNLPLLSFFYLTLATNLLMSLLTAGRIWWIYYTAARHLPTSTSVSMKTYASSIAIILESGIIYSAFVIARIAVDSTLAEGVVTEMLRQVVGIVPTLIIVRVGLGLSAEAPPSSSSKPKSSPSISISLPMYFSSPSPDHCGFSTLKSLDNSAALAPTPPPPRPSRLSDALLTSLYTSASPGGLDPGRKILLAPSRSASLENLTRTPNSHAHSPRFENSKLQLRRELTDGMNSEWAGENSEKPRRLPALPPSVIVGR